MGKAKKGKKGARDEESGDDMEVDTQPDDLAGKKVKSQAKDELHGDNDEKLTSKKKKGKKEKKKGGDISDAESDDEEVVVKLTEKSKVKKNLKSKTVDSSDDEITPQKSGKADKKKGFSVLMDDNDSGSEAEVLSDPPEIKPASKPTKNDNADLNGEEKPTGKKGKKGKKKKQDDDDEDIEKMLAELALEYSGVKKEEVVAPVAVDTPEEPVKKVKTKGKVESINKESIDTPEVKKEIIDGEEIEGTVKSAAQKKKEKKEREKLKKLSQKQETVKRTDSVEASPEPEAIKAIQPEKEENDENEDAGDDTDKKKKKKKGKETEEDKKAKGPNKKMIAAMQEALKKAKEEEDAFIRAEEERIRLLEDADRAKDEAARLEQERRDKKKLKEKERKERLKSEGKLLNSKQKQERARAQALLESLKAQGLALPNAGEKKVVRPGTRVRGNKAKPQQSTEAKTEDDTKVEVEIVDDKPESNNETAAEAVEEEGVKDAWDAESSAEEEEEEEEVVVAKKPVPTKPEAKSKTKPEQEIEEAEDSEDDSDDESDDSEEEDHRTDAEKKREKALQRIQRRREDAEAGKTLDNLRAAVVCVLGHVDTGKTKILDKLRRTNVQDGEAGGITQQIGATNVPMENIKEQTKVVRNFADYEMKIPGLLIIDTPGHESFSNLRSRGSSLCDIAILVVDIMHGIEPQTLESINLLKSKKTPFVVALNKIDRLYNWQTMARKDIRDVLKAQAANTQLEFDQRVKEVIVQFAEQGLNASLFHENPDIRSYVSLVPTSAITGEGICNLLALIVENCQNMLAKRLMFSEDLQATVLEVKAIPGLGTTIDAILINGRLREGDSMILAGTDGPIVTQIRSLLMPQPMKELRVKNAYVEYKEIKAAQGVKIAAKDLEKAIAGLNMQVAQRPDEVEILREEVAKDLKHALSNIKLQDRGVYVQASTLGSLEALLEFLKTSKIPYSNIRIGPVVKKDVMKASTMLEHDSQYATILAFDVKIEKDAQDMADNLGVKIFQADIIYHLFDKFIAYRDELKQKKRDEFKHIAVFPCKLKILPQFIFNSRDPIVMGVMVEAGIVREGTPICVPSREFVEVGVIRSIENNKKNVETARKGQEVCIKIEAIPGEAPKMYGRHFDENDFLVSKISRQSIDACKDYFRDDLLKADWELMVELKKQFEIL